MNDKLCKECDKIATKRYLLFDLCEEHYMKLRKYILGEIKKCNCCVCCYCDEGECNEECGKEEHADTKLL